MAQELDGDNPYGLQLYIVKSPTGSDVTLQTMLEGEWYEKQRDKYLEHNRFTNVSDFQDLDRLLTLEIMVYRWSSWLTQGFDYFAARVNEKELKDSLREYSVEIRQLKQALGIDRVNREKDKGESLGDYVNTLLRRAKEFGIQRDNEYEKAVTLVWELVSMVQTYDRCDEQERRELDLSLESITEWIRINFIADWVNMQDAFRKNQHIWIQEL